MVDLDSSRRRIEQSLPDQHWPKPSSCGDQGKSSLALRSSSPSIELNFPRFHAIKETPLHKPSILNQKHTRHPLSCQFNSPLFPVSSPHSSTDPLDRSLYIPNLTTASGSGGQGPVEHEVSLSSGESAARRGGEHSWKNHRRLLNLFDVSR